MKHLRRLWSWKLEVLRSLWRQRQQWSLPLIAFAIFVLQSVFFTGFFGAVSSWIGQRLAFSLAVGAALLLPSSLLRRRGRYVWLLIASSLIEALFVAQYIYFQSFHAFMRASALRYASYVGDVKGSIWVQLHPKLLPFVLAPVVIVLWYVLHERHQKATAPTRRTRLALAGIIALVFAASFGYVTARNARDGGLAHIFTVPYDSSILVNKYGVTAYSLIDTAKYVLSNRGISAADKAFVKAWAASRPTPPTTQNFTGIAKGKNVLFIQMESYENFVIGRKIGGVEITPNLNKLIKDSAYFSNYHDEVSSGRTADGEFETQNSLYPLMDKVAFFEYPTNTYYSLPKQLAAAGYANAVFHGDVPTFWNRNVAYPAMGWTKYFDIDNFTVNRSIGWGLSDEDLVRQSAPRLAQLKQPFLANVITVTSHTPFNLPKDLRLLPDTDKQGFTDFQFDYIQTLAYTDKQVGLLIDELKKNGLYDNTVLVLFGDHRAFIFDKKESALANFVGLPSFTDASFFSQGEHIPLIIHDPSGQLKGEQTMPASHVDLMPTLLNLLGLPRSTTALGQDLFNTKTPVAIERNSAGSIRIINTPDLYYVDAGDGNFTNGKCYANPSLTQIDLQNCKAVYDQQSAIAKVNDLIIRGNALNLLK